MALYKIKEFPADGAFWRIDWIGKAQPNIDVETEPAIQVHFTKLKPSYQDPLATDSLLIDNQVTKTVGLGQLPLLTAGSVWKDGRLHSHLPPTKRETLDIDTGQELSHIFEDKILVDGNGYGLVPTKYYPVRRHFRPIADAPLAVFPAPAKSRVEYYIIPRFELFRFYYACSSKLARYVWDNSIESAINPAKSGRLEGEDVRIYLRRHMLDPEAYMLGRWLASDVMSQQIQSFRNLRSTLSANRTKGESAALHLDIGFPFTGKTRLVAAGKKIQLHTSNESGREVWAFLVLRLQHCSHPMPYRDIIVDRENRNFQGLNKDDENLPFAWPKNRHSEPKGPDDAPDNGGEPDTPLASTEEPQKNLRARVVDTYGQQFNLSSHRLVKEEVEVQKYRSAKVIESGEKIVDQFGTGEGTYGKSSTGPVNATTRSERHHVTLKPFIQALRWIREQPNTLSVETLALGTTPMSIDGETLYLLPEKIKGLRSWHRIKSGSDRTRGVMVVKVVMANLTFYLLEIERRDKDESFSTLAMTTDGRDLKDAHLRAFLMDMARDRGWPEHDRERFPHIEYKGVNHYKTDTAKKFGERLLSAAGMQS